VTTHSMLSLIRLILRKEK